MKNVNPFILYSKTSHVTGGRLEEALGIDGGRHLRRPGDYTHLLRWGATMVPDLDAAFREQGKEVFNPAECLTNIVNRHHMLRHFKNYSGTKALAVSRDLSWNSMSGRPSGGLIARHRFGKWGRDIIHYDDVSEEDTSKPKWDGYFFVEKWLADFEVRVHIVNGVSARFQIKVKKDRNGNPRFRLEDESAEFVIRNDRNGWHLYPLSSSRAAELGIIKDPIRKMAKGVMSSLGLHYGCVDFQVRVPNGHHGDTFDYRLLEVNSAPGLENSTLDRYVEHLEQAIKKTAPDTGHNVEDDSEDADEAYTPPRTLREISGPTDLRRLRRFLEDYLDDLNDVESRMLSLPWLSCDCDDCADARMWIQSVLDGWHGRDARERERRFYITADSDEVIELT